MFDLLQVKVKPIFDDPEIALADLKSGQIAALANVAAKPAWLFGLTSSGTFGLHFLPIPLPAAGFGTGYVARQFMSSDYPDLMGTNGPIKTIGVAMVMVAANLPPKSERYRDVVDFVDAFFAALPHLQKPPHHPAWEDGQPRRRPAGMDAFPGSRSAARGQRDWRGRG